MGWKSCEVHQEIRKGMKLSIIVPIYKVEPYLRKCVDSLLAQDLNQEEYEIILVDDGSPDDCGKIADEYAAKFGNVRVIHQENGGLSVARNAGIKEAQGKYIQFVDSDDYLEPDVLGSLVGRAERDDLDVLRFNYRNVNERYEEFWPNKTPKQTWGYEESVVDGVTFLNERLGFACYAVQFLIRKELLTDSLFKPNIYFEDVEWTPRMLSKAKRTASIKSIVYNYLYRGTSLSRNVSESHRRKSINDRLSLVNDFNILYKNTHIKWYSTMLTLFVIGMLWPLRNKEQNGKLLICNYLKNHNIHHIHIYGLSLKNKGKALLINCILQ